MKRTWQDPRDLSIAAGDRRDEFGPDVTQAVAELRAKHGLDGNAVSDAAAVDTVRTDLKDLLPGVNRRGFFQLTGAAAVFALAGCYGKHPETVVAYADQPDGTVLGKATWYSTTLRDSGRPVPVMVKCYDGRPIKIEGNPDHPLTKGKADAKTQAALLNLYDPDRIQDGPKRRNKEKVGYFENTSWTALDEAVGEALKNAAKIALITGPVDGPATSRLIAEFTKAFGDRVLHGVNDYTSPLELHPELADVIVTFGGDFLADASVAEQVGFGTFRRLKGEGANADAGQLIAVEGVLSQTGTNADVRVRIHPSQAHLVAWAVAAEVAKSIGATLPSQALDALTKVAGGKTLSEAFGLKTINGIDAIHFIASRLLTVKQAGKQSLCYAGHGPATSAATEFLNQVLGNVGTSRRTTIKRGVEAFTAVAAGQADVVIIAETNPVFSRNWDHDFIAGLSAVKTLVVLDDRLTETARHAHLVGPTTHGLEQWGDAETSTGIITLQQPCIQPLWDTRSAQESLLAFAVAAKSAPASFKQPKNKSDPRLVAVISRAPLYQPVSVGVQSWADYVKQMWISEVRTSSKAVGDERAFWFAALSSGVIQLANADQQPSTLSAPSFPVVRTTGLSLLLTPSRSIGVDGRGLNNAWLQELPDPVSRVTWDNYVAMSPSDAAEQGIRENDVVKITVGGVSVKLPVHIQEGQHPGVVETFVGWGRDKDCAGAVANLGIEHGYSVNTWPLHKFADQPVTLEKTGETYVLAVAQGHQRMEGRNIAVDDVLELHRLDPGGKKRKTAHEAWEKGTDGKEGGRLSAFGTHHQYVGHKWGMTVDLSLCTGCNACVVACSAENNVPVVGRDEVRKGRIMHWMRVDRYYQSDEGDQLDIEAVHQPVMCQQCDNAPCEEVCPAMATVHNDEGQNIMVYNRCIGTRYCSNNCPYKVRRFNWYEYSKYRAGPIESGDPLNRIVKNLITEGRTSSQEELSKAPLALMLNPEITVRSRGVMEKCNFCVGRTRQIRESEKETGIKFKDGAVTSACAQTCPTSAIIFGDLNDAGAEVTKISNAVHGYKLLDVELNTRPSVTYLAKLRNRPATADERKGL